MRHASRPGRGEGEFHGDLEAKGGGAWGRGRVSSLLPHPPSPPLSPTSPNPGFISLALCLLSCGSLVLCLTFFVSAICLPHFFLFFPFSFFLFIYFSSHVLSPFFFFFFIPCLLLRVLRPTRHISFFLFDLVFCPSALARCLLPPSAAVNLVNSTNHGGRLSSGAVLLSERVSSSAGLS